MKESTFFVLQVKKEERESQVISVSNLSSQQREKHEIELKGESKGG